MSIMVVYAKQSYCITGKVPVFADFGGVCRILDLHFG